MNTERLISQIHKDAQQLGACSKFTGDETIEQLITLLYSPQGREFCIEHEFPTLDVLRKFKGLGVERYGIYIDAGVIRLCARDKIFLLGDSIARVRCADTKRYEVYLMHGAHAHIEAYNYAAVHVERDEQSSAGVELFNQAREI